VKTAGGRITLCQFKVQRNRSRHLLRSFTSIWVKTCVILSRFENSRNVEMTVLRSSVLRKWQVPGATHSRVRPSSFHIQPKSYAGSPARRWRSARLSKSLSSVISLGRTVLSFDACRGVRFDYREPGPARRATCDNALRRIALRPRSVLLGESRATVLLAVRARA
jgi:hypothetical protein